MLGEQGPGKLGGRPRAQLVPQAFEKALPETQTRKEWEPLGPTSITSSPGTRRAVSPRVQISQVPHEQAQALGCVRPPPTRRDRSQGSGPNTLTNSGLGAQEHMDRGVHQGDRTVPGPSARLEGSHTDECLREYDVVQLVPGKPGDRWAQDPSIHTTSGPPATAHAPSGPSRPLGNTHAAHTLRGRGKAFCPVS